MKQKLKQNLDLKVLAVLFSVIIWIIVVNIDDPVKNVEFNDVPIRIVNDDVFTENNLVYMIEDDLKNVDVTVTGRRSIIEELTKEDIVVVADVKTINELNAIPLKMSANKYGNEIDGIKAEVDRITLDVEDLKKVQKAIVIEAIGEPAENYVVGDASVNLNQVNVEGPKSVIEQVASAKVQVDVEGATSDVSVSSPIVLYDENGEKIDTTRLSININTVSVTQEVLYTKTVPIVCNPTGVPAEGYMYTGKVGINPEEVVIAGKKSVIDGIGQIIIPSSTINITDMKTNYVASINLENYLPSGVEIAPKVGDKRAVVTAFIEKVNEEEFTLSSSKLTVRNLPEGYTAEIVDGVCDVQEGKIRVNVKGLKAILEDVGASDINVYADIEDYMKKNNVKKLNPGTIDVVLRVELPEGLESTKEMKARVRIATP